MFNAFHHIGCTFVAHAFHLYKLSEVEFVNIGKCPDQFFIDKLFDECGTKIVNIHLAFTDEINQPLFEDGGALCIDTADKNAIVVFSNWSSADRAACGNRKRFAVEQIPLFVFDRDHLRNDFAGLFNDDRVTAADIQFAQHIKIMQTGPLDRRSGQFDGFEVGHWGQCAGLADLDFDGFDHRFCLFGGEFIGDTPARAAAGHAESILLVVAVELDDHAVHSIVQFVFFVSP